MRGILLKVIDSDNVKVLVEQGDGMPLDSADALARIIRGIYECTGLDFSGSGVIAKAVRGAAGSYCLSLTRLSASSDQAEKADEDMYLFELQGPETVFDAASVFSDYPLLCHSGSRLYKYRGKYYLAVYFPPESVSDPRFSGMLSKLSAYCRKCRWSIMNEALLAEWADVVANDPVNKINAALRK